PVQHVDLATDAVGESELKHAMAHYANLRNVRSQAIHRNGSIGFSVSLATARSSLRSGSERHRQTLGCRLVAGPRRSSGPSAWAGAASGGSVKRSAPNRLP